MKSAFTFACMHTVFLLLTAPVLSQKGSVCTYICAWDASTWEAIRSAPDLHSGTVIEMPVVIHQMSHYGEPQILSMISNLNTYFSNNNLAIEFSLCDYIDYDTSLTTNSSGVRAIADTANVPGAVNIYVLTQIGSSGAVAVTSDIDPSWIGVSRFEPSTIVHEMGHYFGLPHTHAVMGAPELVDGSNCAIAGDRFCDTPADPGLKDKVNAQCEYIGTETDANGDAYRPDTSNLMSYAYHFCINRFSEEQKSFMLNTIAVKYSDYACGTTSVKDSKLNGAPGIYPNPSDGQISIDLPETRANLEFNLSVFNVDGRQVFSQDRRVDRKVDLSMLPPGMYVVRVVSRHHHLTGQVVLY